MKYSKLEEVIIDSSRETSKDDLLEKSLGTFLGLAVGNILGIPLEFVKHSEISKLSKITPDPQEIYREWDDDLYLAVLLGEALEQADPVKEFVKKLINWKKNYGRGMGITTAEVIFEYEQGLPPPTGGMVVWEKKKYIAPNGGVMRCAPVAIKYYNNVSKMIEMTVKTCEVTHYDIKCIMSCLLVNSIISIYLNNGIPDLWDLYNAITKDTSISLYQEAKRDKIPSDFLYSLEHDTYLPDDLNDFHNYDKLIGHTLIALQFAIYSANTYLNFNDAILHVIEAGGDTDTNGAVAGAVLGARFSQDKISPSWLNCISDINRITNLTKRLVLND